MHTNSYLLTKCVFASVSSSATDSPSPEDTGVSGELRSFWRTPELPWTPELPEDTGASGTGASEAGASTSRTVTKTVGATVESKLPGQRKQVERPKLPERQELIAFHWLGIYRVYMTE